MAFSSNLIVIVLFVILLIGAILLSARHTLLRSLLASLSLTFIMLFFLSFLLPFFIEPRLTNLTCGGGFTDGAGRNCGVLEFSSQGAVVFLIFVVFGLSYTFTHPEALVGRTFLISTGSFCLLWVIVHILLSKWFYRSSRPQ